MEIALFCKTHQPSCIDHATDSTRVFWHPPMHANDQGDSCPHNDQCPFVHWNERKTKALENVQYGKRMSTFPSASSTFLIQVRRRKKKTSGTHGENQVEDPPPLIDQISLGGTQWETLGHMKSFYRRETRFRSFSLTITNMSSEKRSQWNQEVLSWSGDMKSHADVRWKILESSAPLQREATPCMDRHPCGKDGFEPVGELTDV